VLVVGLQFGKLVVMGLEFYMDVIRVDFLIWLEKEDLNR
jgi:hypothetical protein